MKYTTFIRNQLAIIIKRHMLTGFFAFSTEALQMLTWRTEKGQHEDPIVPDSKLIGVAEIVSGGEFVILA